MARPTRRTKQPILIPVPGNELRPLTVAGSPEAPELGHIHSAKDSNLAITIFPLPPKDGSVTGTLVLGAKLIIGIHENPGDYYIELHTPTAKWTLHGVPSLVAG